MKLQRLELGTQTVWFHAWVILWASKPVFPTPDLSVYHARTHFREKKGIVFQWEAQIRKIKKERDCF